jgi:hypothetical protein
MAKVKYVGPGSEKRTMEVSDQEADELEKRGLWKRVQPKRKKEIADA